jgi:predicted nuclease of predicted toxin-antitoxin system
VRFIVDEAAPLVLAGVLRALGHEANHVIEMGYAGINDDEVVARARIIDAVVISPDLDFSDERRFAPGTHPGIVILRIPFERSPEAFVRLAARRITDLDEADIHGNIVILEPTTTRIRRPTNETR